MGREKTFLYALNTESLRHDNMPRVISNVLFQSSDLRKQGSFCYLNFRTDNFSNTRHVKVKVKLQKNGLMSENSKESDLANNIIVVLNFLQFQ